MAVYAIEPSRLSAGVGMPRWPVTVNDSHRLRKDLAGIVFPAQRVLWWFGQWISMAPTGTVLSRGIAETQSEGTYTAASADVISATGLTPTISTTSAVTVHAWAVSDVSNTTRKRVIRLAGATLGSIVQIDYGNGSSSFVIAGSQTSGPAFPSVSASVANTANRIMGVTFSDAGAGAAQNLYINGRVDNATPTGAPATRIEAISQVFAGNSASAAPLIGSFAIGFIWNRILSASEAWTLYDPRTRWDLLQPMSRRVFFDISAVTGHVFTLTGGGGGLAARSRGLAG